MGKKGSGDTGDGKSLNAGELGPKLLDSIQQVPLENLVHDPANARRHGDRNLDAIMASLKKFGQHRPAVVQQQGMIVRVGNGMLDAAKKLGWKSLACLVVDEDDVSATARAIADNRTGELAEWDRSQLSETLLSLSGELDLEDVGFTTVELSDLMESLEGQTRLKPLDVKPPPAMSWALIGIPTVRFGEIAEILGRVAAIPGTVVETASNDG